MAKKALIYTTMGALFLVSTLFAAGFGRNIQILRTMRNAPLIDCFYGVMCIVLILIAGFLITVLGSQTKKKGG